MLHRQGVSTTPVADALRVYESFLERGIHIHIPDSVGQMMLDDPPDIPNWFPQFVMDQYGKGRYTLATSPRPGGAR
jgi:hypothetical protein